MDSPSSLIRAEMALRARRRQEIHRRAEAASPDTSAEPTYAFETGAPATTQIYLRRGLAREPHRFPCIPAQCAASPHFVLADPRVAELYGRAFVEGLSDMGYDVHTIVLPEGEAAKAFDNYQRIVDRVLSEGIDERSVLISLGGGAAGNLCGFVASTLYRGIGLVHVPTTLMAQCDSAISHKQAVNGRLGKNLVGSYYAPLCIGVDVEVLGTLDEPLIVDGLAEVIKHALAQDPTYIDWLVGYAGDRRDLDFLEAAVRRNIELKCELIRLDPREKREAMVLQYGHTVGHAIEFLSGFGLRHGQAVAIGMVVAARVARLLGACGEDVVELHERLLGQYGLQTRVPAGIDPDEVVRALRYGKRYLTEGVRMALPTAPGTLWSVDGEYAIPVAEAVIREALEATY